MPLTVPLAILRADSGRCKTSGSRKRPEVEAVGLHWYYRVRNAWRFTCNCVSGARAIGVTYMDWRALSLLWAFVCVLPRQHAAQVRRIIIYCVSKHASSIRMLLQWRTQNWRSFSSYQNEFRPTPHRDSGCKLQEQLHGAGEESDDPVINKAPCHEDVWVSGGNWSTHSCPRHCVEMTTKEGIPVFRGQEAEWAVEPVRTLGRRYPVALDSCTSIA